jgi:hypothetical protein
MLHHLISGNSNEKSTKNLDFSRLFEYNGNINVPFLYYLFNNDYGHIYTTYQNLDANLLFDRIIETYNVPLQNILKNNTFTKEEVLMDSFVITLRKDLLIHYNTTNYWTKVFYSNLIPEQMLQDLLHIIQDCMYEVEEVSPLGKVHLMCEDNGYLYLRDFDVKKADFDIQSHYNDDFLPVHQVIVDRLSQPDDTGLVLLHGEPGTGKTYYIRYLASAINKKIIYIPSEYAPKIASPNFLPLMIDNPNSVLIVEDAESIVESREENGRSASVSNLLNIADGLLSDCLNIQIICTFNTHLSNIDQALLRKGRLIANYEFKPLEIQKARALSYHLGFDALITEPTTLADIYNQD